MFVVPNAAFSDDKEQENRKKQIADVEKQIADLAKKLDDLKKQPVEKLSPSLVPISFPPRRSWAPMLAAAAAVVVLLVGIAVFARKDTADSFSADLARVMEQPDSKVITLENQSEGEGTFKVAWSSELGEAVLIGENLPATPDDKAYELWLIAGDQAMAMYVLDPAEDGNVHRRLDAPADPTAWAITVEPKEGTPTATGDIIYIATV